MHLTLQTAAETVVAGAAPEMAASKGVPYCICCNLPLTKRMSFNAFYSVIYISSAVSGLAAVVGAAPEMIVAGAGAAPEMDVARGGCCLLLVQNLPSSSCNNKTSLLLLLATFVFLFAIIIINITDNRTGSQSSTCTARGTNIVQELKKFFHFCFLLK
jgi:hypothetical protein